MSTTANMESNLSLYEDSLQFYLVRPADTEFSVDMQFAREKLEENIKEGNIKDVEPSECVRLSSNFTKKHIVIFQVFEGDCFETIRKTQALVLGPRCVISCFMDNVTLPDNDMPMYNLGMRDLVICLSSFDSQEKMKLNKYIAYMGGLCHDTLFDATTHLVTDSVRSKKYEIAAANNKTKIMKSSWVYDVWEQNLKDNYLATNAMFDKHILPVFYKLKVTTTGLGRQEKKEVEELVTQEGGQYFGEFSSNKIDVVIAKRNAVETPKLKVALNQRKDCLCLEWIRDSVKKRTALPLENYHIDLKLKKITSTPEKKRSPFDNTQSSGIDISNIHYVGSVNETAMSNLSIASDVGSVSRKRKSSDLANENVDTSYKKTYEKLNIQDAKRAGVFLDGCNIFICGFTNEEKERIVKIINTGGATRYDTITSNLSHIVIGNPSKKDITMLQAIRTDAQIVKLEWLVESIVKKTAVEGDDFIYQLNNGKVNALADEQATAASPASKRNILLMSQTLKSATPKRLNFDANSSTSNKSMNDIHNNSTVLSQPPKAHIEEEIIGQYLQPSAPTPLPKKVVDEPVASTSKANDDVFKMPAQPSSSADQTDQTLDSEYTAASNNIVKFLANLKVIIRGFDTDSHESLVEDCTNAGAVVIEDENYKGVIDFLILPVDAMSMDGILAKPKKMVNHNWLVNAKRLFDVHESVTEVADPLSDIPYFYEPIFFPEDLVPLDGMVLVFSTYSSDERQFLIQLAQILGADVQESFCRQNKPLLICPEAKSAKYDAAIRWKLPVVSKNWLMECHKQKKRIPLRNFLVGDAISPVDDIVDDDEEVLCSQPPAALRSQPESRNSSKGATPVITNKRVDQLRGPSSKASPSSPLIPTFNYDVLNELDTPTRDSILQRFKEMDEETPETKRRRYEASGIKTPECATTPYWMEYKRQQCEERRTRFAPTQEEIDKIKNRTPWSEVKRSLWKEALGDEYESPSTYYSQQMQHEVPKTNESAASRLHGRALRFEPETESDDHIKDLADFISKSKAGNNEPVEYNDLPNTIPHDSEMIGTEQHEVIGWRDPSDTVEDTPKRNKPKNTPCFSISVLSDEVKMNIIRQIGELNGRVCENLQKYDSTCTHFVCEKPSRSEKMLSCIAAGKWVLGLSYIEKSFAANRFLNEEEFEWGNPKAKDLPTIAGNDVTIAKAAYRWRTKLHSVMIPSSKGIFKDFRVILRTGKNDSIRTLIEAGRGQIVDVDPKLSLDKQTSALANVTYIFCQASYANFSADEIRAFERANVLLVNVNYLQAYITNETCPDAKAYLFKTSS